MGNEVTALPYQVVEMIEPEDAEERKRFYVTLKAANEMKEQSEFTGNKTLRVDQLNAALQAIGVNNYSTVKGIISYKLFSQNKCAFKDQKCPIKGSPARFYKFGFALNSLYANKKMDKGYYDDVQALEAEYKAINNGQEATLTITEVTALVAKLAEESKKITFLLNANTFKLSMRKGGVVPDFLGFDQNLETGQTTGVLADREAGATKRDQKKRKTEHAVPPQPQSFQEAIEKLNAGCKCMQEATDMEAQATALLQKASQLKQTGMNMIQTGRQFFASLQSQFTEAAGGAPGDDERGDDERRDDEAEDDRGSEVNALAKILSDEDWENTQVAFGFEEQPNEEGSNAEDPDDDDI